MHLCFIDESGSTAKPPPSASRPYFVIAGVIMNEAQWHGVDEEFRKLKKKPQYRVTGEVKWRYFGKDNTDSNNSVQHLSEQERFDFRVEFFKILLQRKSIKTIACITSLPAAYELPYIFDEDDVYQYTYKVVSERFLYYLQDATRGVGDKQLGIVVADARNKKQDDRLRSRHQQIIGQQTPFSSTYGNFVETVFMTPSHLSTGIQFADMFAGAIGRVYNTKDQIFFEMIKPTCERTRGER